jgi:hypothetical protein
MAFEKYYCKTRKQCRVKDKTVLAAERGFCGAGQVVLSEAGHSVSFTEYLSEPVFFWFLFWTSKKEQPLMIRVYFFITCLKLNSKRVISIKIV